MEGKYFIAAVQGTFILGIKSDQKNTFDDSEDLFEYNSAKFN